MILLDYSQIVIANVMMNKKSMSEDFVRHAILNTIRMYHISLVMNMVIWLFVVMQQITGEKKHLNIIKHKEKQQEINLILIGLNYSDYYTWCEKK